MEARNSWRLRAGILVVAATLPALAGARRDPEPDPPAHRFLLLRTFRESTLRNEVEKAATAGYRVVAGVGCRRLVLERMSHPQGIYQYRFAKSREEVNQAGSDGFRMLPLVRAWRGSKQEEYDQIFLMERSPGSDQRWEYTETPRSSQSRVVRMTLGRLHFYGHLRDAVVIIETPAGAGLEREHPPYPFKTLSADTIAEMADKLRMAAQAGWRVIAASDGSLEILLDKSGAGGEPCKYRILSTKRAGTMQREMNEAAAKGFRLLPAATGAYMKGVFNTIDGVLTETFVVMEKAPGAAAAFAYRLVTSQAELNRAESLGYQVVAMKDFCIHEGVVFLERPLGPGR